MSCVAFVVALSLLAAQFTWSQTYDDLCVMMGPGWVINGLYSFEGELFHGRKVYHRQSTPEDGCTDDVYLFWDSYWTLWVFGHNRTDTAGYTSYCSTQDPTQCDGAWIDAAGNNRVSQSQVVADACLEWDCDYINIPDAPDSNCREFDVKLDDEGSNVWYSTSNERYWYFSFVLMNWVCSPQFTSVYACEHGGTWTENYAWIDVERGQTKNIDFEDWIWSDEQNDWVYLGRVSAAVECGAITTTTSTTTTSTSTTDAILSTSSTRSTESQATTIQVDIDVHGDDDEGDVQSPRTTALSWVIPVAVSLGVCVCVCFVAGAIRGIYVRRQRRLSENVAKAQLEEAAQQEARNGIGRVVPPDDDAPRFAQLLREWGLAQFVRRFEAQGYTNVRVWTLGLTDDELKDMGLRSGHMRTFRLRCEELNAQMQRGLDHEQPGAASYSQAEGKAVGALTGVEDGNLVNVELVNMNMNEEQVTAEGDGGVDDEKEDANEIALEQQQQQDDGDVATSGATAGIDPSLGVYELNLMVDL